VPVATSRWIPPFSGWIDATASRRHLRSVPRERNRFRKSYLGAIEENISSIDRLWSLSRCKNDPPLRIEWMKVYQSSRRMGWAELSRSGGVIYNDI
jgi:hypothetical protein